ncbi:LysR family transcriptional regulator [Spirillospora sp. NPDC127200]
MDLRQLRYFRAVAEEQNLTRAAERLGIRATSLSQQIIALERSLEVQLFVRTSGGMASTQAGRALLPRAVALLGAADEAAHAARQAATARRVLRIGVTPGSPAEVVPALWRAAAPVEVEPRFLDLPTAGQPALLHAGGLDLGLLVLPAEVTGLETIVVGDAPLGVLVSDRHRLADQHAVTFTDLDGQELLWFDRDLAPGYHDYVLAVCRAAGWAPIRIRERAARSGLFAAELHHSPNLIALRPQWSTVPGTKWIPLADRAPRLRHVLAFVRTDLVNDLLAEAFPSEREPCPRGHGGRPRL